MTKTSGTKEWAYKNLNIQKGCQNNCSYCYARRMALRFERIETKNEWSHHPSINAKKIHKGYRKLKNPTELYDYMFPTSHDILPENLYYCVKVLKKVLKAGNTVLITTKPDPFCIESLCKELQEYRDLICFRFTVTSAYNETLRKYEPHAPSFNMRREAVIHAFKKGYKTSLSIEPLLDITADPILDVLGGFITETFWIGIMSGSVPEELRENYTKHNLWRIYQEIRNYPTNITDKCRFKDSFVDGLGLENNSISTVNNKITNEIREPTWWA